MKYSLPEKLTPEQVDSICMSLCHDFHLTRVHGETGPVISGFTPDERDKLRYHVKEFYYAIYKELVVYHKDGE